MCDQPGYSCVCPSVLAPPGVFETVTGRFCRAATFSNETSKVLNGWASTPLAAADTSKTCDGLSKSCAALVGGSGGVGSSCSARCQSTRRPPRRSRASQATRTAAPRPASRRAIFGTCACGIVMRWWVQTMRSPPLWLVVGAWRRLLRRWCMASTYKAEPEARGVGSSCSATCRLRPRRRRTRRRGPHRRRRRCPRRHPVSFASVSFASVSFASTSVLSAAAALPTRCKAPSPPVPHRPVIHFHLPPLPHALQRRRRRHPPRYRHPRHRHHPHRLLRAPPRPPPSTPPPSPPPPSSPLITLAAHTPLRLRHPNLPLPPSPPLPSPPASPPPPCRPALLHDLHLLLHHLLCMQKSLKQNVVDFVGEFFTYCL